MILSTFETSFQSNRCHPPTSPNTAAATQQDSHDWSCSRMKRHNARKKLESPSNFTKYYACQEKRLSWLILHTYETSFKLARSNKSHPPNCTKFCACHEKWLSWLILLTYETSCTMRRATRVTPPTSPNTAPATKKNSHGWHMQRHLQCAEQQESPSNITKYCALPRKKKILMIDPTQVWNVIYNARSNQESPSNFTKYCACHEKRDSWLSCSHMKTSFTISGATALTLQHHQILRQPCHMTLMIVARHIWNVIYNARSNRHHPLPRLGSKI